MAVRARVPSSPNSDSMDVVSWGDVRWLHEEAVPAGLKPFPDAAVVRSDDGMAGAERFRAYLA